MFLAALAFGLLCAEPSVLIKGGTIYDGSGGKPRVADIRVIGAKIAEVGKLKSREGEQVLDARSFAVAPGFIDAHSHADRGIKAHPDAESQVRQGITTAVVGQDGGWAKPVDQALKEIEAAMPAINFAMFSGHGGIREKIMGKDTARKATTGEILGMCALVGADMRAGALGVSTGHEYNPGYYSSTDELIALSQMAANHDGMYISHIRDETNGVFDSFDELIKIAREAGVPGQISHIKMAVASVWGKADRAIAMMARARKKGLDITADVYPYLYWQSTITVLTNSRDWKNRKVWEDGLKDIGGPENVRLTRFTPDKSWEGKTLAELERATGKDAVTLILEIIDRTQGGKGDESIVCTSMTEEDLQKFMCAPGVMFCSDGSIGGSHPRGAGSFPRIFGRYVRELKVLSLENAIEKMTSLPAKRFGFKDRGLIRKGMMADLVVFDPKTISDKSTPENPTALSVGMVHVLVNGRPVLLGGKMTAERPGRALRRKD